jgi:hypothetical protein
VSTLTLALRPLTRPVLVLAAAVALFALPAIASGASSSPAAPSAYSQTYPDSTGENPSAADISGITVSNTDAALISFKIDIPNRPTLADDMFVIVWVDSDNNPQTGDPDSFGAEYVILLFRGDIALLKWDGAQFGGNPPATSLIFNYRNGATITISSSDLGATKQFAFGTRVISGVKIDPTTNDLDLSNIVVDDAPANGFFNYKLQVTPPTLVVKRTTASPAKPAAGKAFTLRLVAARSDTGATVQNGRVTCVAKVGNVRLRATVARVVAGAATCTWKIPATAKGKAFRGSVSVVFEGLRAAQAYSAKVR